MELLEIKPQTIKYSPFGYQKEAISKTIKYFENKENKIGKIIMPCGSGKSLTSLWILEKLPKIRRTIIVVPNLILQAQMFETFYLKFSKTHSFICVGSDKDIENDLSDNNSLVTTDKKDIKVFLTANLKSNFIAIITYQSLNNFSEVSQSLNCTYDFAIIDEAHRTVGHENKMFSTILFDENIKIKKRLFMTATEKIYSGKQDSIIGMENEEYYGKTIYEYRLALAIKENVLCDYRVATIFSTNEEIYKFIKSNPYLDYDSLELDESEKENMMCALLATIKAIREKGCKKIITYHSTINKAKIFKQFMDKLISNSLLNIATFHINGTQASNERFDNMDSFKDCFVGVLTNSQALVEGVNIPCVDCVVFADKKESPIAIIQAIGRALRKYDNKAMSYIVIPVLATSESDFDLSNSEFYRLFSILISISIMDETVKHEMNISSRQYTNNPISKKHETIFEVDNKFRDKITGLIEKINLRIWKTMEPFWDYNKSSKWVIENLVPIGIDNQKKYASYLRGEIINAPAHPINIPRSPGDVYKNKGWDGWAKFFGKPKQIQRIWTREDCIKDARKYKTRSEWQIKSVNAHKAANRNGWLNECYLHMEEIKKPNGFWTKEQCILDAKKHKTKQEWIQSHHSGYSAAHRNGWIEECCKHMKETRTAPGYWTKERCIKDAKKYKTKFEWHKQSRSGYRVARKNRWIDECCKHMVVNNNHWGYWTKERCSVDAKKYKTLSQWKENSAGYQSAYKNKWVKELCTHMNIKIFRKDWTKNDCIKDAIKYKTRSEWQKKSGHLYTISRKNGWHKECCKHMISINNPSGFWTKDRCIKDAKKYKTKTQWGNAPGGAYCKARKMGWVYECCKHMIK